MTTEAADASSFPILGETLAVEFANTLYAHTSGVIDFLATGSLITAWFAQAPAASALRLPRRMTETQCNAVRGLRDAVHAILAGETDGDHGFTSPALAALNRAAARASSRVRIEWDAVAGPRSIVSYSGGLFDVFVAQLATDCIAFLAGPGVRAVRRCAHPECEMLFVQHHRTRRFCHDGCSHRARQARYYRASAKANHAALMRGSSGGSS